MQRATTDTGTTVTRVMPARSHADPTERARVRAVVLSFLWPGLGQLYLRRPRVAAIHALPPLALVLIVAAATSGGLTALAFWLISPVPALTLFGLIVGIGLLRMLSIIDARRWRLPRGTRPGRSAVLAVVLCAVVAACHGYGGYLALVMYRAGEQIYEPIGTPPPVAVGSPSPGPGMTPTPSPTPAPLPGGRLTVLLVGFDQAVAGLVNTDTMIFASYDRESGQLVMISLPRDVARVPMYDGTTWPHKINALYDHASRHPAEYPAGGMATLVRQMEFLIGMPLPYYVSIDIPGFRRILQLVDGVTVNVERRMCDPTYQFAPGRVGFCIEAGEQHLSPEMAEAYVRARRGTTGGDFARARRQQQVILALRQKLDDPFLLARVPDIVEATAAFMRTNVPLGNLSEVINLVAGSREADQRNIVLGPRRYAEVIPPREIGGLYALRLDMEAVAELSIELFGSESRYASRSTAP